MRFSLEIELGNAEMQSFSHIRRALRGICLKENQWHGTPSEGNGAKIMDVNGNVVGKWEIIDENAPDAISKSDPLLTNREVAQYEAHQQASINALNRISKR